jgi:uncharacterized membrane protein
MRQGFHDRLIKEITLWRSEGVISAEQAVELARRYRAESEIEKKAGPGKFISTVAVLGATLLGIGIILFFAANWQAMPRYQKLVLVTVCLMSVNYAGYTLAFTRKSFPRVGYSLLFLGMLLFGSAIFLVAQAYHINAHFPNGFLLWAAGVLPVAYLLGYRTGIGLLVLIVGIWVGLESYFSAHEPVYNLSIIRYILVYMAYGAFLFELGRTHKAGKYERFRVVYSSFGIVFVMASTYLLTFKWGGTFLLGRHQSAFNRVMLFYVIFAAASLLLATYNAARRSQGDSISYWVLAGLAVLFAAGVFQLAFPAQAGGHPASPENHRYMYPVWYNVLLFAEILCALAMGYKERISAFINTGLVFFVILIVTRYFDFLWKLLPRSLFFMLGGVLLIVGGLLLERKRRRVIAAIRAEAVAP